ncbi:MULTISPECIES: hypothetical protein [Rheinheimera]|mgnify:CR=1 FL=1|uniref:Lipoprotein n=1 Tax=Rheinheimera marina TaxID=1774958 RepID=A0ABV9JMN8_9GAMM
MKIVSGISLALTALLFSGCDVELINGDGKGFNSDFQQGESGWTAGFSDYPVDNAPIYQLESGIRTLPAGFNGQGYLLSGMNRSDDLFMFLKQRLTGLEPSTRYYARLRVSFLTNAGENCMGVGGAPGESVYMKLGYHQSEPKQEGYYLNADKGQQSQGGSQAAVIGHVGSKDALCDGSRFAEKTIQTSTSERLQLHTDATGAVWVFLGTDSGYEGLTQLYYRRIELALERY